MYVVDPKEIGIETKFPRGNYAIWIGSIVPGRLPDHYCDHCKKHVVVKPTQYCCNCGALMLNYGTALKELNDALEEQTKEEEETKEYDF